MGKTVITIVDNRFRPALRATLSIAGLVIGPVFIGIVTGSTAMQWIGFVFGWIAVVGLASRSLSKNTRYTVAEARELLAQIEADMKRLDGGAQ